MANGGSEQAAMPSSGARHLAMLHKLVAHPGVKLLHLLFPPVFLSFGTYSEYPTLRTLRLAGYDDAASCPLPLGQRACLLQCFSFHMPEQ